MNYRQIIENSNSIAIIRTDKIGDMVLTLPLFQALKEKYPNKKLTLIASKYTESLLKSTLNEDDFICFEDKKQQKKFIKESKFDVVFFPRPRFNEALYSFLNSKYRIGSKYRWYSFLFNIKINDHRKNAQFHEAEYNMRMLTKLIDENIEVKLISPKIIQNSGIQGKFKDFGLDLDSEFIIIHAGSGGSARDWSIDNFKKLILELEKVDIKVILTGIKSEIDKCNYIFNKSNCINLCDKLEFDELLYLISKSKLLIANSTGVIHLAASLDVNTIGFYPNSPHLSAKRWGPYSKKSIILSPLNSDDVNKRDDMNLIPIEEVVNKVELILNKKGQIS